MREQSRIALLILGILCSGVLGSDAVAQAPTPLVESDVAPLVGSWTLDEVKTTGATEPERRVIAVGPDWVRVEVHRPGDDHPPVLVYNLDGSRKVNAFGSGTATTEIRRDGTDIVTVTVFTVNDRPVTVEERLTVSQGGELTAAVRLRIEHGYEGVLPPLEKRPTNVSETVKYFRRSSPGAP
jgi:hypothetical protein